jgi:hypothetical protein
MSLLAALRLNMTNIADPDEAWAPYGAFIMNEATEYAP